MDGNDSNDPMFVEDFPSPGGRIPAAAALQVDRAGLFPCDGQPIVAGRDLNGTTPTTKHRWSSSRKASRASTGRSRRRPSAGASATRPKTPWRTIVGVAGDERDDGVAKAAPTIIYWPMVVRNFWGNGAQVQRSMAYAIRSERPKSPTLLKEIQQAVWSVNGSLPVASVRTLERDSRRRRWRRHRSRW